MKVFLRKYAIRTEEYTKERKFEEAVNKPIFWLLTIDPKVAKRYIC